ncbi:MAG: TfuA-like protein [Anderseniella sp.]
MIVFAGPSLARADLSAYPNVTVHPPAKQGDVYLATLDQPSAIGIIDGYFEGVPSIWHKEILWALSQGIAVFGAASMGALRAAELDSFGMAGIGSIYQAYSDGELEDDDEVALLHGPEEVGYVALSEAMVNVRATCASARAAGIVTDRQSLQIIDTAKSIYYKDRTWAGVFSAMAAAVRGDDKCLQFADWITQNRVDQKRLDAMALMDHLENADFSIAGAVEVQDFHFENTDLWQRSIVSWRQNSASTNSDDESAYRLVRDERLYLR